MNLYKKIFINVEVYLLVKTNEIFRQVIFISLCNNVDTPIFTYLLLSDFIFTNKSLFIHLNLIDNRQIIINDFVKNKLNSSITVYEETIRLSVLSENMFVFYNRRS